MGQRKPTWALGRLGLHGSWPSPTSGTGVRPAHSRLWNAGDSVFGSLDLPLEPIMLYHLLLSLRGVLAWLGSLQPHYQMVISKERDWGGVGLQKIK